MIDYISVEKSLPIPEEYREIFSCSDLADKSFVTTSLPSASFRNFCISESGPLYLEDIEFEESGEGKLKGIKRVDYTAEIDFGLTHVVGDTDYEIFFKALYFKGELKELSFLKVIKTNNEERVRKQKRAEKISKDRIERVNSWTYIIFYYLFLPLRIALSFSINALILLERLLTFRGI